ncbi:M48 family metalloprotease [Xanthomonas campestris pv. asclepiadis]|uniref:M48 family metalloprotease n=1 Tax=Xanthomonas campestris TaxID=339 RepID=UPI001E4C52CC|nr:M48 family metalloprotease [Xanthomonas campestris]MCC4618510.1 M48 family metalloprotease [Xanthomonas campestris pv. asclepiadis]
MTVATRQQLQRMVDAIAARAHVAPPRVKLWRRRDARYNALSHTITVSMTLARTLDAGQLYTLLAHEVGHAKRRAPMLKRAAGYFWPPALALVVGGGAAAAVTGVTQSCEPFLHVRRTNPINVKSDHPLRWRCNARLASFS